MSEQTTEARPAKSSRRKWLTVIGVVVGVIVVLAIIGSILGPPPADPAPAAPAAPTAVTPAAPAPVAPPVASPAGAPPQPMSLDQIDAVLSPQEKREYAVQLLAVAPSIEPRIDRSSNLDEAGKFLARDGVRLCQSIAGRSPAEMTPQIVARFEVTAADAPAVLDTTQRVVCTKL